MATITVKNVPDKLYKRLKQAAAENRRSMNSEVIVCLERTLQPERLSVAVILERARRLREKMPGAALTDEEFTRMKSEGRK